MSENFNLLADSMLESMREYCNELVATTRAQPCVKCAELSDSHTALESAYEELKAAHVELAARLEQIPPGPAGKDGEQGESGAKGERGLPGQDGRDGRDGQDGERGRDALELHILDAIDPTRTYKRGTWACHDGGLVSAFRSTDPLEQAGDIEKAGWAVRVYGLSLLEFSQTELRSAILRTARTAEKPTEHVIQVPGMIHRGVWKAQEYVRGDCVQYQSSLWVCTAEGTSAMPGTSHDWVLSARKGADGNRGKDGERGERGAKGEPYSSHIREVGVPQR